MSDQPRPAGTKPEAMSIAHKAIIRVGQDEQAFIIPILGLFSLSPQFARHVILELPKRDSTIIYREIDVETFTRLGDILLRGYYTTPATDMTNTIIDTDSNRLALTEEEITERQLFARYTKDVHSITGWAQWLCIADNFENPVIRAFAFDFIERYDGDMCQRTRPRSVNKAELMVHAKLHVVGAKYNMDYVRAFTTRKLLRTMFQANLTFDFVSDFAQTVRFIFKETKDNDPIHIDLIRISILVGPLMTTNSEFVRLLNEFDKLGTAVWSHGVYDHISAMLG